MERGGRIGRARLLPLLPRRQYVAPSRGEPLSAVFAAHPAKGRDIPALFAFVASIGLTLGLSGCSERFDWREYRSTDGFVVALPGRWQTVEREIDFAGTKVPMTMTSTGIGGSVFAVGVARLPSSPPADDHGVQRAAAFFADGLVRNVGATRSVRTPIAVPRAASRTNTPGFAVSVAAAGRAGRENRPVELAARIIIVDDRAIQVVAIAAPGEVPPAALETFFTSFRLVP